VNIIDRIFERIKINEETGCWEWQGRRDKDGYGKLYWVNPNTDARFQRAHRVAFDVFCGPIVDNLMVCHSCDNPRCVYPLHLWQGTARDNKLDCCAKGRAYVAEGDEHFYRRHPEAILRGEQRGQSKLTDEIVREIRHRKESRNCTIRVLEKQLAQEFGVCVGTIKKAMWGQKWKHVA
jgi:hypothetical protein